jgi:hypothetical protein
MTSLQSILNNLGTSAKSGVSRQELRIKDIAQMSISSVVNLDASIRHFVVAFDGKQFELSAESQIKLQRYILRYFGINSLDELTTVQAALPLS